MITRHRIPLALSIAALASVALAGPPDLRAIDPPGAQRGTPFTLTLTGEHLAGAQAIHFYRAGLSVTKISNTDDRTVVAECVAAPECELGEHPLRLRTSQGFSELRTVYVGALPVVREAEPNSELASAQKISMQTTVHGTVTLEDQDYFAVEAKAGDRLVAEIEAMRLGRSLFDPAVAILDQRRFELAVSDDSALLGQDSSASCTIPSDGVYYICVREASYAGGDACVYRLHVGSFPRPLAAWPPGGRPGEKLTISWPGDPGAPPSELTLPATPSRATPTFASNASGFAASPNYIIVLDVPVYDQAQPAPEAPAAPLAIHGVIAAPGEEDRFRFRAKAGEVFDVRLLARRLRTPLDGVLEIANEQGAVLAGNDDTAGADPELRWTAPADGLFETRVRDHRSRGGPEFVYRVEIDRPKPALIASIDRIDARRPQFMQVINVPRGNRFAVMMRAERIDAAGEVAFEFPTLPAGVSVSLAPVGADLQTAPVVFSAAADAPIDGGLYAVGSRIGDSLAGGFKQVMPLVLGPPNDTVYYQTSVDRIAIAVTDASPFRIKLNAPSAPLLRQGSKSLKVVVERDEGFAGEVVVHMLWNPPGVSSGTSITIPAGQTEGLYPLNAAGDAPLKSWPIAATAHASISGGDVWISSEPVTLTVADTYVGGAVQMGATEQGKTASLLCKIDPVRPFEGKAKLTLLGLPPKTSCSPREIGAEDREIVFEIKTEADAPIGQHRGLFCELELSMGGETVTHRLAYNGVLRIDAPPANSPAPPPPPPAPAAEAPAAPPPKPLSRLEELRRKAKEQGEPK